jgi:hypothetical protein
MEQGTETGGHRLGLEFQAFHRVDRSKALSETCQVEDGFGVVTGGIREKDLAAGQAFQCMQQRLFEDQHALQVGELMRLPQKVMWIDVVVTDQAEQRGAVAMPVSLPDVVGSSLSTPRCRSMYSRIERLMCGKMCGVALCSVLSRSNSQTRSPAMLSAT